jgi:outer membrane protein OmpA-like peptidoglycan-associated protein
VAGEPSSDAEQNGCPPDRDGDGVSDADDACPDRAGERSSDATINGCPKAWVDDGQIKITERIQFETNSAKLLPSSTPALEAVLEILRSHTEIAKVAVEGHTDDVGNLKYNQRLSARRAAAVAAWLAKRGISKARLTSRGFGPTKPLDPSATPEARERNRRVEFQVQE